MCAQVPCVYIPHTASAVTVQNTSLVDGYFVLMSECAEWLTQQAVQTSRCAVRPTVYWPLVAPLARRRGHVVTQ